MGKKEQKCAEEPKKEEPKDEPNLNEIRPRYIEDQFEWQWRRCWNDFVIKFSCGSILGLLANKLLTTKKSWWPFIITLGSACGMAYQNCEVELTSMVTSCAKDKIKEQGKIDDCA